MHSRDLLIPNPCDADWSSMSGDDRMRFCQQCGKHVHNLSAMPPAQARAVVAQPEVCVRYQPEVDGSVRFQSRRRFLLTALAGSVALPAAASVTPAGVSKRGLLGWLMDRMLADASETVVVQGELSIAPQQALDTGWSDNEDPQPVMGGIRPMPEPPAQMGRVSIRDAEE